MLNFLIRRLAVMIPTLIAISILVFTLIQLPPGDYLTSQLYELQAQGEATAAQQIEFLRAEYGLDKPMYVQYWNWVTGLLQGDLGQSFEFNRPVSEVLGDRLLMTFILNFSTILFIWVVSFPIAVYSATHQYSIGDYGLTFLGFLGLATPNFLLALVLLYLANVW
ncbi:MAG TPA: ABC transporter permease, partial [Rhodospirillaceae bacterium]|nr:ABC transporter permease [Rhodospirillaceae bacterium]